MIKKYFRNRTWPIHNYLQVETKTMNNEYHIREIRDNAGGK